jgi:hypothetical protein
MQATRQIFHLQEWIHLHPDATLSSEVNDVRSLILNYMQQQVRTFPVRMLHESLMTLFLAVNMAHCDG